MIRCAISRTESRGLHYTLDYPDLLPEPGDTVLVPDNAPPALIPWQTTAGSPG